jgi:mannitol/fructose-specific phosphotransferase system IIA component
MENKKQTAIEWLVEKLREQKFVTESQIFIAKAMEKDDLFEVFRAGFINGNLIETKYFNDNKEQLIKAAFKSFEHYYTSTYEK